VPSGGRARDPEIDERVLAVARRHLSEYGYQAMSLSAVAGEAGTTRQALYRRWHDKAELAAAVVAGIQESSNGRGSDDPFHDLVTELTHFQRGVSHQGRLSLVGTMLQETTDAAVRARYRAQIIAPRRKRLREILQRGVDAGLLDADADLEVALTMCTGSWYGRALAGARVPRNWPYRSAALVWRACGGDPPQPA
jgi:AcrR family transcriptional regulator